LLDSAQRRTQTREVRRTLLVGLAAAFVVGAHVSPLAHWADTRSFAAHMAQHLLVGDLAPLALVLALRPYALSPAVALPVWAVNIYLWHVPVIYEAALHHVAVHAVQHAALFVAGLLLWSPVFELTRTPPWFSDATRLVYLLLTMFAGLILGALLLWWPHTIYSTYANAGGFAGLSAHDDQRAGGGLMLLEGSVVIFAVAAWVVWRIFAGDEVTHAEREASPSP
jgi:putative membrane protein